MTDQAPLEHVPITWTVAVTDIPARGLAWRVAANAEERARIGAALDLQDLSALVVDGRIEPLAGGSYRLKARLTADLAQACVVTLDPVASRLDEPIRVEFRPDDDNADGDDLTPALEAEYDIEPIVKGTLETGRVVFELLAASVDPYPRAPGIAFAAVEAKPRGAEPIKVHPFAALAKLKDKS